jgi:hypothetical protein
MSVTNQQFDLLSLILVSAACPVWIWLIVTLPQSPGFGGSPTRFAITPIVLTGFTIAVHRIIRNSRRAWPLSILTAPLIAIVALFTASTLSR